MKPSAQLADAMNEHMKNEFYSSYLYLAMAAWSESAGFEGAGQWMRRQAAEEHGHGMKFYDFLLDRGATVVLKSIPQPPADFGTLRAMYEQGLRHEEMVSQSINRLYALALQDHDFAAAQFLDWFVKEQVEEEKTMQTIVDRLTLAGGDGPALLQLDRELASAKQDAGEAEGGAA